MMDQRLGAVGSISEVETEDKIVEVNFGRWDSRVNIQTFVYVRRRPFHPTRLEAVVKELPRALGCGIRPEDAGARINMYVNLSHAWFKSDRFYDDRGHRNGRGGSGSRRNWWGRQEQEREGRQGGRESGRG